MPFLLTYTTLRDLKKTLITPQLQGYCKLEHKKWQSSHWILIGLTVIFFCLLQHANHQRAVRHSPVDVFHPRPSLLFTQLKCDFYLIGHRSPQTGIQTPYCTDPRRRRSSSNSKRPLSPSQRPSYSNSIRTSTKA